MASRRLIDRLLPERQIYHRSHGQVHFVALSRRAQLLFVFVGLSFFTWVAYASVNVVFKGQILKAKERKFHTLEASYEARISDMQSALDDLSAALNLSAERFESKAEALQDRHQALETVDEQKDAFLRSQRTLQTQLADAWYDVPVRSETETDPQSTVAMHVARREIAPRTSRPKVLAMQEDRGPELPHLLGFLGGRRDRAVAVATPWQRRAWALEKRMEQMRLQQASTALEMKEFAQRNLEKMRAINETLGLDTEDIFSRFGTGGAAVGGPLIALNGEIFDEDLPPEGPFEKIIYSVSQDLQELNALQSALGKLPLARPVDVYRVTSWYGARRDPFTRRAAFHGGLDFAGRTGTPVRATAAGVVVKAGTHPGYGRLIEIDHGNGVSTRYGHLRRISVKKGDTVKLRDKIGALGNSGRSTGPHLHYEVLIDRKTTDPMRFLEAGRYVFKS